MAGEQTDQGAKKDIAKGMDESGKGTQQQPGKTGTSGKGEKGSDQVSSGMAESGSGAGSSKQGS